VINTSEEELFRSRLAFLSQFVSDIERQLGVLEAFEKVANETQDETLNAIIQTVVPAIKDRLILCAAQLLDDNSGTNLRKFLSHYRANKRRINHLGDPISDQVLDGLIASEHLAHRKIQSLRDKALAHLDRKFTENPDQFLTDVGLSFEKEIVDVVNHAQTVLAKLSMAVNKSARISVGKLFWASTVEYFRRDGKLK